VNPNVVARTTISSRTTSSFSALGLPHGLKLEIQEGVYVLISNENNRTAAPTVATIRATQRNKLFTPKMARTGTTVPRSNLYRCLINKLHDSLFTNLGTTLVQQKRSGALRAALLD
jgi:hypothetical protein